MTKLRATARLQFHAGFPIDRAVELVGYFADLGISHLYASPLLMSRPGSTHGYDIVDHNRIDPELGGEPALRRLVTALRGRDMGLILDIVPNHMGVGGSDNAWWLDVLEWGRASPYADFFDIDWEPPNPTLRGKLLAPFLGAAYGDALAGGDVVLQFDPDDGRFIASVYGGAHRFPITPRDYPAILRAAGGPLDALAELFSESAGANRDDNRQRAEAGRAELRTAAGAEPVAFAAALAAFDPHAEESRDRLHGLLERQHYRLAWWRAASDEINWRRFFDINGLAGVRQEVPAVFEATHAKILAMYAEGLIDGVRIDHVDGLADPHGYCRKLRRAMQAVLAQRPEELRDNPPLIWVEKILFTHERLLADWQTDGTTGYDFMNEAAAVLHDPAGEAPLTHLWTSLTARPALFEDEAEPARRLILRDALSSELWATAAAIHRILRRNIATRDWTLTGVRRALEELLVHFHTYRVYAGAAGASETDARALAWAMAGARRTIRSTDQDLLTLLHGLLSGEGVREMPAGAPRRERLRAMVRFQQLSAPTAAKSVEDTAFYRYGRLLSRNEVGSEPSQWALPVGGFHNAAKERRARLPRALLATATHDHKRGEDTRVRLAVLSEIPDAWEDAVGRWTRLNLAGKREVEGTLAPDAADELMIYQTIVSAWPLDLSPDDGDGVEAYRQRLLGWLEKAMREAKRHSGWAVPNEPYEAASRALLDNCLDAGRAAPVLREMAAFAARIALPGAVNGLSQAMLRLTSPGVPDLYQGTEFWDFSLVDPDNRRPVDFDSRIAALAEAREPAELLSDWRDGRVKQAVVARALALRARKPELFAEGLYEPLRVEGPAAEHVLAYARTNGSDACVVAVTRLAAGMLGENDVVPLVPASTWGETKVVLPRNLMDHAWVSALDLSHRADDITDLLSASNLFRRLPVALLETA